MWYEIIPTAIIVSMVPMLPQIYHYYITEYLYGNPQRKDLRNLWDANMFYRDARLTGIPWVIKGLDSIPDD